MKLSVRVLPGLFGLFSLLSAQDSFSASPAMGTLTDSSGKVTYSSGPFTVSNPTGNAGPVDCSTLPCDEYKLTVTLPAGYAAGHSTAQLKISTVWSNTAEDYDLYVFDSAGKDAGSSHGGADPEEVLIKPVDGSNNYTIRIVPSAAAGGTTATTISLVAPASVAPPQAQPIGVAPRYYVYPSPGPLGNSAGEPSIGYNWNSQNGMFLSSLQTLKIVFPGKIKDAIDPVMAGLPAICDASWSDVSAPNTSATGLDPILWTDSKSGRTFVSQLTGANSAFAFTDNDGSSWTPGQAGPPDGGPDHQTVGTGPYPAGSPFAPVAAAAGIKYAVYYCSQGNAAAFCSRSDNGGLTFGNGNPIYITQTDCGSTTGALHGHVKVSPVDGAVYVAPKDCGGLQAVTVSKDTGVTWKIKTIPGTDADSEIDPSVAIDAGNRLYQCHIRKNGHVHVQTSDNQGDTWANDYDIGLSQNIELADFPEMVAGDKDRAACAFIGSTTPGNHDAKDYPGIYFGFVATTYDGGKSWHTVNVTPGDPVQGAGGVCNGGTLACGSNRNLLDFNEITMDEKGYPLFGFADGCIGACVQDPVKSNGFANKATIVRQVGGRPLIAKNDPASDAAKPLAACLFGSRVKGKSSLNWRAPDNGGSSISSYSIFRAAQTAGPFTKVGTSSKEAFDDTTVDDSVANYYYRVTANNVSGQGTLSNFVNLPITAPVKIETSCALPGITVSQGDDSVLIAGGKAPDESQNLEGMTIAEPPALADKIIFTIYVKSFANLAPSTQWLAVFTLGDNTDHFVEMTTEGPNATTPAFKYGDVAVVTANAASVTTYSAVGNIDPKSNYDKSSNTIQLIVPRSTFGAGKLDKGVLLKNVQARTREVTSGMAMSVGRQIDGTSSGSYMIRGVDICAANTAPLAMLTADVQMGLAPLAVNFGVFGSDNDAGDSLASYSLDFGDGSAKITDQPFTAQATQTVRHTYSAAGSYTAKLTVKDSQGLISSNVAQKTITASAVGGGSSSGGSSSGSESSSSGGTTPGIFSGPATGRFGGGSLGFGVIGLLGLAGLRRRRHG